jgi:hypothetical protein
MRPWIAHRFAVISEILERPWFRVVLVIWAVSGAWDLAISQWIPEKYSQHLPKMYQMVAMTADLLPWQVWLFSGMAAVAAAAIEAAARHRAKLQSAGLATSSEEAKDDKGKEAGIKPEWKIAALMVANRGRQTLTRYVLHHARIEMTHLSFLGLTANECERQFRMVVIGPPGRRLRAAPTSKRRGWHCGDSALNSLGTRERRDGRIHAGSTRERVRINARNADE